MNHFQRLINLYKIAPIHNFYEGIQMELKNNWCKISLAIDERYFHGGHAVHGSVYFKLLDDASYFSCQTIVEDYFLLTKSYEIKLIRPINAGIIYAIGEFESINENEYFSKATLYTNENKVAAIGEGIFVKSKTDLFALKGYALSED